jgi:hypothetical protein
MAAQRAAATQMREYEKRVRSGDQRWPKAQEVVLKAASRQFAIPNGTSADLTGTSR